MNTNPTSGARRERSGKSSPKKTVVVVKNGHDEKTTPMHDSAMTAFSSSPPESEREERRAPRSEQQFDFHVDENLLERARTWWQFGDWESLLVLDIESMQQHPDRARLALFAAAGHLQVGSIDLARQFVQMAHDWGCSNKLLLQVLTAGVHNSIGKAAALAGNSRRALQHFESAIRTGSAGSDTRLMVRARANEQFAQLGLKVPDESVLSLPEKGKSEAARLESENADKLRTTTPVCFALEQKNSKSPISLNLFFSEKTGVRARSLKTIKKSLDRMSRKGTLPGVDWVCVGHGGKTFFFTHFSGDYIPATIAQKKQFYESPYLDLLARLHQPGKLIVDGGANIGNHSVFFAGVMGASVIAFEPQPYNHHFLVTNMHLNNLSQQVEIRKTAIGDRSGRIPLVQAIPDNYGSFTANTSADTSADTRLTDKENANEVFDVDLSTLDEELIHFRQAISIIKLDLEGMELAALHGARQVIMESVPVIAVECFNKASYLKIKEFLGSFDYYVIDSTNATPTFIFLSRRNPHHQEMLLKYLETSSVGKFVGNKAFNKT